MTDYSVKSYGRNEESAELFGLFDAGRDVSMHGPRRLGKTFLLDLLVERANANNWTAVTTDFAGCTNGETIFRALCEQLGASRPDRETFFLRVKQTFGQLLDRPESESGPWYQPLLTVDYESYLERLVKVMEKDPDRRWLILIDELPIALKAMHDKGPEGVREARDFMNLLSKIRARYPSVRWMITGSIGIEPLATEGNYLGVLSKFNHFELFPLTPDQSVAFLRDLAVDGRLPNRSEITAVEMAAVISEVGWLAPYYLEALAQRLRGKPATEHEEAAERVEAAVSELLQPVHQSTFGTWEEHLRKHYREPQRTVAFELLTAMSKHSGLETIDALLTRIDQPELERNALKIVARQLQTEGFLIADDWDLDSPSFGFLNPLLRRWWRRYEPPVTG